MQIGAKKKIFVQDFVPDFSTRFGPKKILMHFQRGAGGAGKCRKNEKKIEKFFEKKFFQKKFLCHFLIPGANWSEKKFVQDFFPDFSTWFGPKKILMHFQRGAGGDGKCRKSEEKIEKFFKKIPKKNLWHFLISGEILSDFFFLLGF